MFILKYPCNEGAAVTRKTQMCFVKVVSGLEVFFKKIFKFPAFSLEELVIPGKSSS